VAPACHAPWQLLHHAVSVCGRQAVGTTLLGVIALPVLSELMTVVPTAHGLHPAIRPVSVADSEQAQVDRSLEGLRA
jgi:hypothetical protein